VKSAKRRRNENALHSINAIDAIDGIVFQNSEWWKHPRAVISVIPARRIKETIDCGTKAGEQFLVREI
jgi:hypothetical protein